jgi:serine/threonine protein kinase
LSLQAWPAAPYHPGGAVSDDTHFVGRELLLVTLRALFDDIDRPGFILGGPRRSGKSSVLERLARLLTPVARVVRLDLLSMLGHTELWHPHTVTPLVLQCLLDALENDLVPIPSHCRQLVQPVGFDITGFRRQALPILLNSAGPARLVVLLDEMEVAQTRDPHAPQEIAAALTPSSGFQGPRPLLGLVWGRSFGKGLAREIPSLFKDFHREEIARFSLDEVGEALRKPVRNAYSWHGDAVERVWHLTSGHPLFIAAIGAAVHSKRLSGTTEEVFANEVDNSIEHALQRAETWHDAWRQLSRVQQLLLRAVAESPPASMEQIVAIVHEWGGPFDRMDFEPAARGISEDGAIQPQAGGLGFQVQMIRCWIRRIDPIEILARPEDPRDGLTAAAARQEEMGRRLHAEGRLAEAADAFKAALEADPARWSAAVWLGQILLQGGQPEEAALMLRAAAPTPEVQRIRAQALARWLKQKLDRHDDPASLVDELRSIDPYHQDAPEAAGLIAQMEVEDWWRALQGTGRDEMIRVTEQYIFRPGGERIPYAIRFAREAVEAALEGRSDLEAAGPIVFHVVPYLLRESESAVLPQLGASDGATGGRDAGAQWEHCYATELSALVRLGTDPERFGSDGIPPSSLQRLIDCQAARTSLGAPLERLVRKLATAERIAVLTVSDAAAARGAAALWEQVDRTEGTQRLSRAFADAALAASAADAAQVATAMEALPAVGLSLVRLLRSAAEENLTAYLGDLVTASSFIIERLEADPACMSLTLQTGTLAEWRELLGALFSSSPAETTRLQAALRNIEGGASKVASSGSPVSTIRRIDVETIREVLGSVYRVERQVPYHIYGVPPGYIWAWSVDRLGRNFLARAYRVDGGEPSVQAFLAHLWENERRLLSTLATRWEGRALPRLHFSRFEPRRGMLVLVTDFVGPLTLRDLLTSGEIARVRRTSRATLWSHLQCVVDALAALHRAGYIHRAVRPENILVDGDGRASGGRTWLRLTNFEWSVYLYGIANSLAPPARLHDRYLAPERLAIHRATSALTSHVGEGTTSDIFALGLVMFECLLEPLNSKELEAVQASYGLDQHVTWIKSLLVRVDQARSRGSLGIDEVSLLKELLNPDTSRRCGDIDSVLDTVSRLSQQEIPEHAAGLDSPLQLVTTLEIGTNESIARFIKQELPQLNFPDLSSLSQWLERELRNAAIRPNRRAGAPLLLEAQSLNFTVEPFAFRGSVHQHVGWLKVAKEHDGPAGAVLCRLTSGVKVYNYRRDMSLAPLLTAPQSWAPWFTVVERLHEGLTIDERAFVNRVRWSIELERDSWARQILPYKLVDYKPGERPGESDIAVIRDRGDRGESPARKRNYTLADLMAQSIDRDNVWFELGPSRDPTSIFQDDRRWIQEKSDENDELIRLIRHRREGVVPPPAQGWIRPYSLAGHRTLYRRRKDMLADIERDQFLVRSLLSPENVFDDLNLPPRRVFDPHLDEDKKTLSLAIQNRSPLFVVQGPPGTGKTTLAAEVILRTLYDQPSSRILVVSQAHDPLNNLLERVEKALDGWPRGADSHRRPSSVRLTSEERLDERRYGTEGTRVPRKFHPSRVAAKIMADASTWRPGDGDISRPEVLDAWRRLSETQALHGISRSLERRLATSANLVYATANDRRLAALRPGTFDLVIYEEAAKATPIELLGPLRLARRWLLIGDQAQLAPFGLDDVDVALKADIQRLRNQRKGGKPLAADIEGVDPNHILGAVAPPPDIWAGITEEMTRLLRFFGYVFQRAASVPMTTLTVPDVDTASGALKGLSGMLTTQWRMHPVIGSFVSKCFYQGRVGNGDPKNLAKWRRHGLLSPPEVRGRAIVWLDIPWMEEQPLATERPGFGGGWENGFEARVVLGFIRQLLTATRTPPTFAIVSPYRAQVNALAKLGREYRFGGVGSILDNLHTADSFQGKQADVVVVSLVRNNKPSLGPRQQRVRRGIGFLETPERSTVIFSRAERLLVVAGCLRHFRQFPGTTIFDVAQEIDTLAARNGGEVTIVPGQDFLEARHWEDLAEYHRRSDERKRRRRASQDQRLKQGRVE